MRGKAIALTILVLTGTLGTVAIQGSSGADESHDPIFIDEVSDLTAPGAGSGCECVRSGNGSSGNPLVIADWLIKAGSGTAITIRDVRSVDIVVRSNTLKGDNGVRLLHTGDAVDVDDNTISFRNEGVYLENSAAGVLSNTIQSIGDPGDQPVAVMIQDSSPLIRANHIARAQVGVQASFSSPHIDDNEFVENDDAVLLTDSTDARLTDNVVRLAQHWGLVVRNSAKATLIGNEIREGRGGIIVQSATLYMEDNRVMNQREDAVRFTQAVVTMFRNTIEDNWRGAFGSKDSDVLLQDNVFSNNDQSGIELLRSEGKVLQNTVVKNHIGIKLDDTIITLEDNELLNNTFGFSIPHNSRQSIPLMENNTVNGVNVDGTTDASEQVLFYQAAGQTIEDRVFDAASPAWDMGTLTKQGAVVIYDSVNVTVEENRFAFNQRGVFIYNSSFVTVQNNTFDSNMEAVVSVDSRTFVKNVTCEIDIDPEGSVCVEVHGGVASIRFNTIAHVDVGIHLKPLKVDARAHGGSSLQGTVAIVANNTIRSTTHVGIKAKAALTAMAEHEVTIRGNHLQHNVVGMELDTFHGTVRGNVVGNSSWAGIHLEGRTNATLEANLIVQNERGVVDASRCSDGWRTRCGTAVFIENRIVANAQVGVLLQAGANFEGDVVAHNGIGIESEERLVLRDVELHANARFGARVEGQVRVEDSNITANGADGLRVNGRLILEDSNASRNGDDGFQVSGEARIEGSVALENEGDGGQVEGAAVVLRGNFSSNNEAGLRLGGTVFEVRDCEASLNLHGVVMTGTDVRVNPSLQLPDIDIGIPSAGGEDSDPLHMHECNLVSNHRFALRASATVFVNATLNFWGTDGPRIDTPVVPGHNVYSQHALVSPYYQDREHTQFGFLPTTAVGPQSPA